MRPTPGTHVFLYMQDEICKNGIYKNGICKNESWRKKYNTGRGENKNPQPSNE